MPVDLSLLDQLRDVIPPPEPGFWPPAIGWWTIAILLVAISVGFIYLLKMVKARHARQHLTRDISNAATLESGQVAVRLSILMRKVAMTRFPQSSVAGLTGEEWLEFLDQSGETDQFTRGPGRLLTTAPYDRHGETDVEALVRVCMSWVRHVT